MGQRLRVKIKYEEDGEQKEWDGEIEAADQNRLRDQALQAAQLPQGVAVKAVYFVPIKS